MTPDLPGSRVRSRSRLLVKLAGVSVGLVIGVAALGAGSAGATVRLAAGSAPTASSIRAVGGAESTGLIHTATGDSGRRSFGVQPAGPKKPDPRPNFTYQNVAPGQTFRDHVAFVNISSKLALIRPARCPDAGVEGRRRGSTTPMVLGTSPSRPRSGDLNAHRDRHP